MATEIKPIRNDVDHEVAMAEIERLWGAPPGSIEGDRLDVLATLVDAYEDQQFPIDLPDPIAAIQFRMEQQGLSHEDLVPMIGSREQVGEVLARKRVLTLSMIRRLHEGLGIPADVLIKEPA
jgi:HTH-type transcriptional regulator / antitoxin HigA